MRYYRLAHSGTTAVGGRYYRTGAVLRPPTAAASTVKPDTKKEPSNRGDTSTRPPRYYGLGPLAVLLLWSGTTAPRAVLPLVAPNRYYRSVPRYYRWDQSEHTVGGYQRYYCSGRYYRSRAVLPLVAPKRYYRSGPRYYRWDQRGHKERRIQAHQRNGEARREGQRK